MLSFIQCAAAYPFLNSGRDDNMPITPFVPPKDKFRQQHLDIRQHFHKVRQLKTRFIRNCKFLQKGLAEDFNSSLHQKNAKILEDLKDNLNSVSCSEALHELINDSIQEGLESFLKKPKNQNFYDDLYLWNDDKLVDELKKQYMQDLSNEIHSAFLNKLGISIPYSVVTNGFKQKPIELGGNQKLTNYGNCPWGLGKNKIQMINMNLHPDICFVDGLTNIEWLFHEIAHALHVQVGNIYEFEYDNLSEEQKEAFEPLVADALYAIEIGKQKAMIDGNLDMRAYESAAHERLSTSVQSNIHTLVEKFEGYIGKTLGQMLLERQAAPKFG